MFLFTFLFFLFFSSLFFSFLFFSSLFFFFPLSSVPLSSVSLSSFPFTHLHFYSLSPFHTFRLVFSSFCLFHLTSFCLPLVFLLSPPLVLFLRIFFIVLYSVARTLDRFLHPIPFFFFIFFFFQGPSCPILPFLSSPIKYSLSLSLSSLSSELNLPLT
jgi:hypothetical protein